MVEHTDLSRPSQTMVIKRTNARVVARYGVDVVRKPSRTTAFRVLAVLERRHPTFRLSTKRNRDIADAQGGVWKLRPTRPGEYVLMDSTPLDVFALDPLTLRWVRAELTVALDGTPGASLGCASLRCRRSPSMPRRCCTKHLGHAPRDETGPRKRWWPDHGIPRVVLMDVDTVTGPVVGQRIRRSCRTRSSSITVGFLCPSI